MRIALDARNIYRVNRRGTGKNLIDLYQTLASIRPNWRFFMFYQIDCSDDPFADFNNVEKIRIDIRGDRFNFWQQIRLPISVVSYRCDVLHCPANTAPMFCHIPMVVTVHDLNWLSDFASSEQKSWSRNLVNAIKHAARIITPSEYTKSEIIKRFSVSTDNIIVNYWAADRKCRFIDDRELLLSVKSKYGLGAEEQFVFSFGARDVRKNTRNLLIAWSLLPFDLRRRYKLLIVGLDEQGLSDFGREVIDLGIEDNCILSGFAEEKDLPVLLSSAEVLCYVSLSEGFGLPILDAFVCRTAVIASDRTSIPEVAGEAAFFVDPYNPEEISGAISRLLKDEKLRSDLVERGVERVKQFSWQRCAERLALAFESVISG